MTRFTPSVGGCPRSTSEADRDDASDGEMETDDGPGIPWISAVGADRTLGVPYAVPNRAGRPTVNLPEAPFEIDGRRRDERVSGLAPCDEKHQ